MQTIDARVLVLGEREDAKPVESALRSAGYEDVHVSHELESPGVLCETLDPAIVLIDLTGPDFAGLDALRSLAPSGEAAPPVAVLSAPADSVARTESLALGAKDFIAKPVDDEEVRVRVGNLVETR